MTLALYVRSLNLWHRASRRLRRQEGQGMVEYGLILALIAVALIGTWVTFGTKISEFVAAVQTKIEAKKPS